MLKNNGFHNRHSPAVRGFNPASFFVNGEQGWVYDPSNMATLFQDSAGTTPVTAMEQPIGLQLDLSGRGNHRFQSNSANRPVLSARVNLFVGTAALATQSVTTRATTHTLTFTGAGSITLTGTAVGVYTAGTHSVTTTAGTLTATVSGTVTQADIRETNTGVGLPAYQQVVTSTNYDSTGFPVYIKSNGSNQFFQTSSINFTSTASMTIWQGLRILAGGLNFISELGPGTGTETGVFYLAAGSSTSAYGYSSKGTAAKLQVTSASYTPPKTNVLVAASSIAAPSSSLRVNGSLDGSNTNTQGFGNYGNYPVYFYSRAGVSLYFTGNDYGSICRGAVSSADQITSGETWINQRTNAY